jgi:hypothetical protein
MKARVAVFAFLALAPAFAMADVAAAAPASGYTTCYVVGLQGEIAASNRDLSATEVQISALKTEHDSTHAQLQALTDPDAPADVMGVAGVQQLYDSETGSIAKLQSDAQLLRDHIAKTQAKIAECGRMTESASR